MNATKSPKNYLLDKTLSISFMMVLSSPQISAVLYLMKLQHRLSAQYREEVRAHQVQAQKVGREERKALRDKPQDIDRLGCLMMRQET